MRDKEIAVLKAWFIISSIFSETRTWTCKCGAKTSILSEICEGCGREDCEQGSKSDRFKKTEKP